MKIQIQACSDKGCIRDHNEDMVMVGGQLLRDNDTKLNVVTTDRSVYAMFVSDGMGGHEKGEVASQELLCRINLFLSDYRFDTVERFIADFQGLVGRVGAEFNQRAAHEGQGHPMGCTLTGVVIVDDKILLVNCGDSRTYRFRNGILMQLTTDDTERGITGDPNAKKLLLTCVGGGASANVHIEEITERIIDGDMLVMCSDGLTDEVNVDEMEVILANDYEPAMGLVERAKENGGSDNVSVMVALYGEGEFGQGTGDEFDEQDGRYDAWA